MNRSITILGVRPPAEDLVLSGYEGIGHPISVTPNNSKTPNLGLFYISSILRKELSRLGYDVDVRRLDMAAGHSGVTPDCDSTSSALKYGSGTITKRLRGMPITDIEHHLMDVDLVFFSMSFTSNAGAAAQVARRIKSLDPSLPILVGGRDAQHRPGWYLENGFDVVFLGQAEGLAGLVCDELRRTGKISAREGIAVRGGARIQNAHPSFVSRDTLARSGVTTLKARVPAFLRDANLGIETLPDFTGTRLDVYDESSDGPLPPGVEGPVMWYQTSVGCPRECGFCASAGNPYLALDARRIENLLVHYRKAGIKTLLSAEDNFLARLHRDSEAAEKELIEIMKLIRRHGFANEFTDGLEVGLLMDRKGRLRSRLIEELFRRETKNGRIVGTHRIYWPIETFVDRKSYSKLRSSARHLEILKAVLAQGVPQIGFGMILFQDTSREQLRAIREQIARFCDWMLEHQGVTEWRLAIFHELPLPGSRNYDSLTPHLEFSIDEHPELWALPINPLNGTELSYLELFEAKRDLMQEFDPDLLQAWDSNGKYALHRRADQLEELAQIA